MNKTISNDFQKSDFDFLSSLIKKLLGQNIKWTSDIFKLFAANSNMSAFSKESSLLECQIEFLHECCVSRDMKIILIDLDDDLNCTIIGQLEPLSRTLIEDPFNNAPPMILLRRLAKLSAGPGTWLWRVPEYYHVPLYKIIQLKGRKDIQLLYLFNKIQYIRMKTLVSNGMVPISDDGREIWKFDKNDFQSDKIKESLDLHFAPTTAATTPTAAPTATSTVTTSTATTLVSTPLKTASSSPKVARETEQTVNSLTETPSKNEVDENDDDDDDEVIFRRPGWKRKRPKCELESFKPRKKSKLTEENYERKRTEFDVKLSQATDKTYKCKVFKCGKKFTSWAQFNQHQDDHSTACKHCCRTFKTSWGCDHHSKTCAERHKPKPRLSECTTPAAIPAAASPDINSTTGSPITKTSNSMETITEAVPNVVSVNDNGGIEDDDDEIKVRRAGGKRKRSKLEQENSLKIKKKNKFDWILSQANDETYICDMPQCGKKFTSWAHFDKHQNDHRTQCKDCYKIFSNRKGLETHLVYCTERHKPKPKVYECQICCKEFITELQLKSHVECKHQKEEFIDLAENLRSKIAKKKRRKEKKELIKQRRKHHESVLDKSSNVIESSTATMSAEQPTDVIEISDDEDGEIVCKPDCDCVLCKGLEKYFCK